MQVSRISLVAFGAILLAGLLLSLQPAPTRGKEPMKTSFRTRWRWAPGSTRATARRATVPTSRNALQLACRRKRY